ncbi:MAG: tRNA dihydrouridine synthase DusB [Acholeplasmatales bacterium]|jgi:nifR3 family TIM-barrel protein|nr:tRNA dihydrouridine synthase DusB [Acholeplasmatales bacterium]
MKIGNVEIKSKFVLAPLAGISNFAFRKLNIEYGAALTFSEMVSDKGLIYNGEKTKELLYSEEIEHPFAIQIFGSDLDSLISAAIYIDKFTSADIIDINMGCPVPKVAIKSEAGSRLLKNPLKIYEIVKAIVSNVSKPVTCKIRTGWDSNNINAVEVAKLIEKAGASGITIHGRTRAAGYSGEVDYETIKKVKDSVSIPVIGNGDVVDVDTLNKMLETGCDLVMIGRGAIGNPFIFRDLELYLDKKIIAKHSTGEIVDILKKHYSLLKDLKGELVAIRELKGIAPMYFKGIKDSKKIKIELTLMKNELEFYEILKQIDNF